MIDKIKKTDMLLSLIIGLLSALMIIFVGGNLSAENSFFEPITSYFKYLIVVFPLFCVFGLLLCRLLAEKLGSFFYQIGKFILVGGFNFLLDVTILNSLIFATGAVRGPWQSGFKAVSFIFGAVSSYLLNKHWTFQPKSNGGASKEILRFAAISSVGFTVNVAVDYVFVNMIGSFWEMKPMLWAQFSAVIAAIVAMSWNFIGYKFFVFKYE